MEATTHPHLNEEQVERFIRNELPEDELCPLEEHLLICHQCQDSVRETEEFFAVTKRAASEMLAPSRARSSRWSQFNLMSAFPKPVWAVAACAAAVLALALVAPTTFHQVNAPQMAVLLTASRGAEGALAHVRAGVRPVLQFEMGTLPASDAYQVRVIDAAGSQLTSRTVTPGAGTISIPLDRSLAPGSYWVRVYNANGDELLREYGIVAE